MVSVDNLAIVKVVMIEKDFSKDKSLVSVEKIKLKEIDSELDNLIKQLSEFCEWQEVIQSASTDCDEMTATQNYQVSLFFLRIYLDRWNREDVAELFNDFVDCAAKLRELI